MVFVMILIQNNDKSPNPVNKILRMMQSPRSAGTLQSKERTPSFKFKPQALNPKPQSSPQAFVIGEGFMVARGLLHVTPEPTYIYIYIYYKYVYSLISMNGSVLEAILP